MTGGPGRERNVHKIRFFEISGVTELEGSRYPERHEFTRHGEGRNGAKQEQEMLQTALSTVCQVTATGT